MKILVDTNVVLDVLLDRDPFAANSSKVVDLVDTKKVRGYLAATSVTTLHYLADKALGKKKAKMAIDTCLRIFDVAQVDHRVLVSAHQSEFPDFEDAVIHEAGIAQRVDVIVTRNPKHFKNSVLTIQTPDEFLAAFSSWES